jgi:hypothetical protein
MVSKYTGVIPGAKTTSVAGSNLARPDDSRPPVGNLVASASKLLNALWRSDNSTHFISIRDPKNGSFRNQSVANVAMAIELADQNSRKGLDVYFACAEYLSAENRKESNVAGAYGFWLDIDIGDDKAVAGKGYRTIVEAEQALTAFCTAADIPLPTHTVLSGGGLHVYWALTKPLGMPLWKAMATKLKELAKTLGFLADPSRTTDIASVLRIPGTNNYKTGAPRPVTLKSSSDQYVAREEMLDAINRAHEKFCNQTKSQPTQVSAAVGEANSQLDLEKLTSALTVLNPDCDDFTWKFHRIAVLAALARDHAELHDQLHGLAKDWSSGKLAGKPSVAWTAPGNSNGRTGAEVFDEVWDRFVSKPHTGKCATLGTIYFHAKEGGWVHQSSASASSAHTPLAARNAEDFGGIDISVHKMWPLQTVQQQYCLINIEGRLWTLDLRAHHSKSAEGTASKLVVTNLKDAALLVRRALRRLGVDGDGAFKLSNEFFNNPQTVCFDGVEFNPVGSTGNYLNLWVGPTLAPKAGGWTLMRAFLREIICNDDQVAFDYLIHYLAHALQRPEEKPGIMVIMIGGQGIGKGTLGKILRLIWSATYYHIHKIDDVTGNFNAALERAFIVFLDEALFVGDRKASDALKSLVTEPIIQINEKYQPACQTRSYHRFFAATNAEHFKNTERDDRRDFVLKVSEAQKDDHAYWSALNNEIEHGGVAAMMHDLLAIDLSGFNVRAKPSTKALVEQKIYSLGPVERWWHNALSQGEIDGKDKWPDFMATADLIEDVMEFSGGKVFRKPSAIEVVKTMKQVCPSAANKQLQESFGRHRGLALNRPGFHRHFLAS